MNRDRALVSTLLHPVLIDPLLQICLRWPESTAPREAPPRAVVVSDNGVFIFLIHGVLEVASCQP